ncbi:SDR family NAD(P)-dependent oxidoreductase [Camelimonas abortus]|uniref:SDR family NAD(P)-dependent oxidoreductase n=1 Tax=Camelimonas abortus TaxID=1017184 RepID=A0ABV7LDU0_9HYPH
MASRRAIRTILLNLAADVTVTACATALAIVLRFQDARLATYLQQLPLILACVLPVAAGAFLLVRLPQSKWRFTSLPDVIKIAKASAIISLAILIIDTALSHPDLLGRNYFGRLWILLFFILEIAMLAAPRVAYRALKQRQINAAAPAGRRDAALIAGTGIEIEAILRGIEQGALSRLRPVGALSRHAADVGQSIRNVRVLGGLGDAAAVLQDLAARDRSPSVIVLAPSALGDEAVAAGILNAARRFGVEVLRTHGLDESDSAVSARLAPLSMEDLLLRPAVSIDEDTIASLTAGRRIAITGGGGSIGGELARRLARYGARDILILENSEPALHAILEDLSRVEGCRPLGRICDVRDRDRLFAILGEFRPNVVYHAAALKHVHYLETDWSEGIRTNVFGAMNAADAAIACGAEAFVMISTDKAVKPVSILGATKRLAEMYVQAKDAEIASGRLANVSANGRPTRLVVVRFGNVLGSNGSVVPKFREQIAKGGPVTVTHPEMVRFFMTIPEACDLVVIASFHAINDPDKATSIYVLNMGRPVKILDLATRMIELAGLRPNVDIDIVFTGMRPGERLEEIVLDEGEATRDVSLAGIIAADPSFPDIDALERSLDALAGAVARGERSKVYGVIHTVLPTFPATPDQAPQAARQPAVSATAGAASQPAAG